MKLTEQEETQLFAINCVVGKNYSDDYEEVVQKAEELKETNNWEVIGDKLRKRGNCQGWYLDRSKIVRNSV